LSIDSSSEDCGFALFCLALLHPPRESFELELEIELELGELNDLDKSLSPPALIVPGEAM
jgi:hypothetical protein